jgi:hypothetical protein
MDWTDVLPIVQQFINVKAVGLAVILTQFAKYLLPSPSGERTAELIAGKWYTRAMPFLPLAIGIVYCTLVERTATVMEDSIRGIFTGSTAAYAYRTAKVSIFGA